MTDTPLTPHQNSIELLDSPLGDQIVSAIKRTIGASNTTKPHGLHEPEFPGNEWAYIKDCLDTKWVSSVGSYVDRFEDDLADYTGVKKAIAAVNGTAALQVAYQLAGVAAQTEVLMPALTFVATANAATYLGATPHFVDSCEKSLGVDPEKLKHYLESHTHQKGGRCINNSTQCPIVALVAMHTYGHPGDLDALLEICQRHNIILIEDAAEALGTLYKGKHVGNHGYISCLSFNGNKVITTGGGGAILTNDLRLAVRAKHLTTTARQNHKWEFSHDEVGYNFRLPNINAALGCAQLESLDRFILEKRHLAHRYIAEFNDITDVQFVTEPPHSKSNYWLNTIRLKSDDIFVRNSILEQTHRAGFITRPTWKLMHHLPMYSNCPRMPLSTAEQLERSLINLPSSAALGRTS